MSVEQASAWNRICALRLRGNWQPGQYNAVLLIAQVILLWTPAQRGMDYLTLSEHGIGASAALNGIEADIPIQALGLAFLIPAGVGFIGLATGWPKLLSLGHLFIGASYLVLGITFLRDAPFEDVPTALMGCGLLTLAAFLLCTDSRTMPDALAIPAGILSMVAGGWLAAHGLGTGYRTGNGFLGGAALHFVMGFGTQIMARREERLRREEEEDFLELRLAG